MSEYIDTYTASLITGEADRRIREKIEKGLYLTQKRQAGRGGTSGESHLVAIDSLAPEHQIAYMLHTGIITGPASDECDLAGYRERYGDEGVAELLQKMKAVQKAIAARALDGQKCVQRIEAISRECSVSPRTLYRWMDAYEAKGLPGIMKPIARKDKGALLSICPAAYKYAYGLYANQVKRTHSAIYYKLCQRAAELGSDACKMCLCNPDSPEREQLAPADLEAYPPCADPDKMGMRVPESRQTVSRMLSAIPDDEKTLARFGRQAFQNKHLVTALRMKPDKVNAIWDTDHHQFDVFVLDENGVPVRAWMTAFYDVATGCLISWVLSTNPNSMTIIEAFVRGVAYTKGSLFHGPPVILNMDNGMDYKSKAFKAGLVSEQSMEFLRNNIGTNSVVQALNVSVHHTKPYWGQSKTIERFFGSLEDHWLREVPGWCGGNKDVRPEDFERIKNELMASGELWTLDELYDYIQNVALPEYHNRPHSAYDGRTPLEMYSNLPRARDDEYGWDMLSIARQEMVRRTIGQQGIKFQKEFYWDDALIGQVGKEVTIRYSREDISTITVILDNRFLCEAHVRERLKMLGEDPEKVAAHIGRQKRQTRETMERIRRASRSAFMEDADLTRTASTITALEYRKAAKGKTAKRQQLEAEEKRVQRSGQHDPAREMFQALGREALDKQVR